MKKLTTEEFIRRAKEVHGDVVDYSLVDYNGIDKPVAIICKEHQIFYQTPYHHLKGQGCPLCGQKRKGLNRRSNTASFIEKAIQIHGDYYDYSKVDYKTNRDKVCIICPIHGEFWQTPNSHLNGAGCEKCAYDLRAKNKSLTVEEFIDISNIIHGGKYDYTEAEYKNMQTKVRIICHEKYSNGEEHGVFIQTPSNHVNGKGCPHCKFSKGERIVAEWLSAHNIEYIPQYCVTLEQVLFNVKKIRVDFYLPYFNTFIEYNGEQHYRQVRYWHKENGFENQVVRDRRLREHCKQHGIRLIEIPYTEIDNIDKILKNKIK